VSNDGYVNNGEAYIMAVDAALQDPRITPMEEVLATSALICFQPLVIHILMADIQTFFVGLIALIGVIVLLEARLLKAIRLGNSLAAAIGIKKKRIVLHFSTR
jgi:hypothetical protein